VLALKGALYWRLGKPDEARTASERALDGEMEARAEALNTLGHLARSQGEFENAANYARRAASLWRSLNQHSRWVDALNNIAVAEAFSGKPFEALYNDALNAAGDNPLLMSRVLANFGLALERNNEFDKARLALQKAAELSEQVGVNEVAAWTWNNLGVLYHRQGKIIEAKQAYSQALQLSHKVGEKRVLGVIMANLAELTNDKEAWHEALRILENAGHKEEADQYRTDLPLHHPFREQEIHLNGN
jgi:tetratricopeptide (TPR) repeat protein